jgi:23S rRNA (cytosine1962-C5)-methyltransferase
MEGSPRRRIAPRWPHARRMGGLGPRAAARTVPDRTDRPLDPDGPLPTVAVRSPRPHPFLFKKMVEGVTGPVPAAPGDLVRVVDRAGAAFGYGLWNPRSRIAVRLLTQDAEPPGAAFWQRRIDEAVALRRATLRLDETGDAYRAVHAEGDGLSGLIADRLGEVLSVECFSLGIYQRLDALLPLLAERLGTTRHRVRVDERIAVAEGFAGRPVASPDLPASVTIQEHGVRYRVRFEGSHKTGFFCDQRDNRFRLAEFCRDREVLDVCCYTGGFALNARLRGGARGVTGVDLDEKALALARENANLNQARIGLVHADAFGYLRQMAQNARTFGAVVLDPPKLIGGRDEFEVGRKKYLDLNSLAMNLVEPGGLLLSCSCSGLLPAEEFVAILRASARRVGRSARLLALTGAAPDHPVALDVPETAYLKAAWLILGDRPTAGEATGRGVESMDEPRVGS